MNQVWGNITGNGDNPRTLVVVFLRGGADGLTLVPPIGDSDYWRKRPVIAVNENTVVRLEGEKRFGLHPLLAGLTEPYSNGDLAVIHCVGSEDSTRSHFEAQDLMEHGGVNTPGGWDDFFVLGRGSRPALCQPWLSVNQCLSVFAARHRSQCLNH